MRKVKLDKIWKHPFQDPIANRMIAELSFDAINQVIKTGQDFNLFYDDSLDVFKKFADFHDHSDLSTINRITKFNCTNILNKHTVDNLKIDLSEDSIIFHFLKHVRISNVYGICKEIAKARKVPDGVIAKLFYKDQRYSELNQIISFLILYRNYSAHSTNERNDLGLCLSIGSKLLRFTELLEIDRSKMDKVENLRQLSIKIIKDTFKHDPTDEINAKNNSSTEINTNELILEISNNINFIKENITNKKSSLFESNIATTEDLTDTFLENTEDDYAMYQDSNLTITQLKQKLLEHRKSILKEFELKNDDQNILSRDNIESIIRLGVSSLKEWKKINSVNKNYSKYKKIMDKQLEKHWSFIQDLLSSIDWLEN